MTEAEWLACMDPEKKLEFLEDKVSARKFRLYHCAALRLFWPALEEFERRAIEVTEQYFDTPGGSGRPATRRRANKYAGEEAEGHLVEKMSLYASDSQCQPLLLCIFGNPFRPASLAPSVSSWNDSTVVRLAQAAYDDRVLPAGTLDKGRLAVLADALEEAGCADADVLGHLRGPGPHVRGCWPVDLCLGKS